VELAASHERGRLRARRLATVAAVALTAGTGSATVPAVAEAAACRHASAAAGRIAAPAAAHTLRCLI
jgi:hypothetical protein